MTPSQSFRIDTDGERVDGTTLVVGQTHLGMAGLTAADYLVRHLEATQIGHVAPDDLPAITPFEEGVPRHHSRLYALDDARLTLLVGELFVPAWAAKAYTDTLLAWAQRHDFDEIAVLHGVPFPHGPDEHEVFFVATDPYRERRLAGTGIQPLSGGFFDGIVGELVTRSLEESSLDTGVLVTPTHPPGPDVDAAIKLLDAVQTIYGFAVDETELVELSTKMKQYYEQLADRMERLVEGEDSLASHDYPEDRMYM